MIDNKIWKGLIGRASKAGRFAETVLRARILCRIPALYETLEIHPTSCTAMITNRCDLKCIMCKQWRRPKSEETEMTAEGWKGIIDDLRMSGIRNIHFTGGEPLLRKDLSDIIAYASAAGFTVGLTTNGMNLDWETMRSLSDAGLRSIALSMDALDDEYSRIRGIPGSFDKVKTAAFLISEMRRSKGLDASINYTLMKDTMRGFCDLKEFADTLDLPVSICLLDKNSSIFNVEKNRTDFWVCGDDECAELDRILDFIRHEKIRAPGSLLLNFPMIDYIKDYFRNPRQVEIPCVISQDRIIIDPYGNLLGGCMSMGTYGNLSENSFRTLCENEKYKAAKKKMFYKVCAVCSCGYQFNIRCMPFLAVKDMAERVACLVKG